MSISEAKVKAVPRIVKYWLCDGEDRQVGREDFMHDG